MDKEQINELKPGDEVLIRGRFEKIKENGDFSVSYLLTTVHGKLYMYKAAVHPSAVIIKSPPKYDPTRLFKKGDKVRVVERNSRCDGRYGEYLRGAFCEVLDDEEKNNDVHLNHNGSLYHIDPAYIELITPVEELEPYKLIDSPNIYNIVRDSAMVMTIHKKSHPNAKAAADAECARLNEEYRKEQK